MKTSRRGLLKLSAQSLAGMSLGPLFLPRISSADPIGAFTGAVPIVQLMTNHDSAQFSVLTPSPEPYAYRAFDNLGRELPVRKWDLGSRVGSPYLNEKLTIEGLQDNDWYRLEILDIHTGRQIDERLFKNLPLNSDRPARFAMVSCAFDIKVPTADKMWQSLSDNRPDMIFFTGDTSYADYVDFTGGELGRWKRYVETRLSLHLYRLRILIPTFAIWDDHDFGLNNGDKTFALSQAMLEIFELFWRPQEVPGYQKTFGVGFEFSGFGQKFCFMDNRSYRDVRHGNGFHWGSDQQDLLLEGLDQTEVPTWILSGSQFFGCYKNEESFQIDHPKNFVDFLQKLARVKSPVVFGSGDVHFSEIMKLEPQLLGYQSYEFTSSSIHSFTSPHFELFKNARRESFTWKHNYLIIDSARRGMGLSISTESYGVNRDKYFSHQATVSR
jgi:alkaline phosphatase D